MKNIKIKKINKMHLRTFCYTLIVEAPDGKIQYNIKLLVYSNLKTVFNILPINTPKFAIRGSNLNGLIYNTMDSHTI